MRPVLWHSNAPWAPTGYGVQTALFTPLLAEDRKVFISANYGLEGAPMPWNGIAVLPGLGQTHGNEAIPGHVAAIWERPRDGIVLTLYDAQVFDPELARQLNMVCWTPVDSEPLVPALRSFFRKGQAIPLAMTRYGMEQLAEFDPIYVPHGIDAENYRPLEDRTEARERMGVPKNAFLVGMVAANKGRPSRKCFAHALRAFRIFHEKHKEAQLYLHTTLAPEYAGGEDIMALLSSLRIEAKAPHQYPMMFNPMSSERMREVYGAFDVILNPSMGEGFGVPVAEAQACGVPAIVNDFGAQREVCGAGWKVAGSTPYWTGQSSWMQEPDVGEIVAALEDCYSLPQADRRELAIRARTHALQYDVKRVYAEHFKPALEEIEERLGDRAPLEAVSAEAVG